MKDWRRRIDAEFFAKERHLLDVGTTVTARYDSGGAALRVIAGDRTLRHAVNLAALLVFLAATGLGALHAQGRWQLVVPFALAVVAGRWALPEWPAPVGHRGAFALLQYLALVVLPSLAWRASPHNAEAYALAMVVGFVLLFPLGGGFTCVLYAAMQLLARGLRFARPAFPRAPWTFFPLAGTPVVIAVALAPATLAQEIPLEVACLAVASLALCVAWVRLSRATVATRSAGYRDTNQAVVPLLDRSGHEALGCWRA